jgi:hypothetical protein
MLTDSGPAKTVEFDCREPSIGVAGGLDDQFNGEGRPIAGLGDLRDIDGCHLEKGRVDVLWRREKELKAFARLANRFVWSRHEQHRWSRPDFGRISVSFVREIDGRFRRSLTAASGRTETCGTAKTGRLRICLTERAFVGVSNERLFTTLGRRGNGLPSLKGAPTLGSCLRHLCRGTSKLTSA